MSQQQCHRDITLSARLADNCPLPKASGTLNLSNHAFVFFEVVPSTPITVGITVTLVALWILLRSFNFENQVLMLFHLFLLSSKDIYY